MDQATNKLKKYRQRAILPGISAVLILLLGFTNTGRLSPHALDRFLLDVTQPAQTGLARIGQGLDQGASTPVHLSKLYKENKALEKEAVALTDENRKLNQIVGQVDYLRAASEVKKSTDYKLAETRVIGKDPSNYFSNFEINRGKKDGTKKDAIVLLEVDDPQGIIAQGLVDRMVDVGDNWAKVTAIINESQSVVFKNIRNQEGGIPAGRSGDLLWGYSYDNVVNVVSGDRLISSGVGDLYEGDVYLGTVGKVKRGEEKVIQEISLKSTVDFKKVYQAFVMVDQVMVLAILISGLVFFLDISFFQQIPLLNQVNFLLLVLVALAYQSSWVKPVYLGFYLGFLYDPCLLDSFGSYMLSFFATGFFIQSLVPYFNSNSFVLAILTGILSFLFHQLFTGIFYQLLRTGPATEMVLRQSVNFRLLVQGGLQELISIFLNRYKRGKYDSLLD